ncbi:type I polyketide synthase [Actinoplanes auranticolor]|uniref:Polyketide synthase n=1 Tax=Actinoplanes auranticolor TaxID=47988 RepID=A0A919STN8_9ACTN|nr:type I polyketide synthase [Actinoplanes auranticolor]GIM78155.1 polyketide synthase [Actinoplanes auranticolor]
MSDHERHAPDRPEPMRSVPQLLQANARRLGDRTAFADDVRRVTWSELERRTARLAGALGVERGDRVAFCLGNGVDLVEVLLAAVRAGAVGVPLSPYATGAELAALIADCEPAVLVTDEAHLAQVTAAAGVRVVVHHDGLQDGATAPPPDDLGLDEPAFMLYTSGTGGVPKGAISTQRAALWSAVTCYGPLLGLTSDDHLLWPLPMAHSFAHSLCVLGVTAAGASARIVSEPDPATVLRLIADEAPTVLAGVPATYRRLLDAGRPVTASLRIALVAGAASDPALRTSVEALLGAPLLDCYGSTETCGMIAVEPAGAPRRRGTSGPPAPGVEVRLVDPATATAAEPGARGEIWVRGPNLMLGYHRKPAATARALQQGWYRTGDLGELDEAGHLSVVGRVSDRIIRGGTNVDPAEIERVLEGLAGVREAAVVARAHPLLGEVPVAFVVRTDETVDEAGLLRACAQVLSAHKVPEEVIFAPVIPRTRSGKPRHALLRESLAVAPTADTTRFSGLPAGARRSALTELVRAELSAVCGPVESLTTAFADLGVTSMAAMTVWHRLSLRTGLRLPATVMWDHPSPAALVAYLESRLPGGARTAVTERPGAGTDPVAIVAVGCRYPGGVSSPEDLWRVVAEGVDATSEFPSDRGWDVEALYDTDPDRIGTSYTRRGGFLHEAADFDPAFFGISPREALATDPQQRLLLEVAWEVFERAGIPAPELRDSDTGVFVGLMHSDYASRLSTHELESHLGVGSAGSLASGRIAYVLGLRGPALTIDTACSSSLVAMDLAARSLRAGECSLAIAGGVTVMSTPGPFLAFSRQRGLSPDGRCRSFSAGADGTAWAEGAGLVLLERLDDARRNGHPVLAVLRGSAVNSDGASNGLTAPNGEAQRDLIRLALADAGLRGADIDVVEGHGTATRLGDPIEATAVLATYGQDRDRPVWLGSVKSNLGHTQAAAGIAGVIKVIEAMRHQELPRSLYAGDPSPHVDWSAGAVRLLDTAQPWPAGARPRRAAVSSFGIGGTNAHVIIEEPPAGPEPVRSPDFDQAPWLLSAADEAGLRAYAGRLADAVPAAPPADVAYSLATGRAALGIRAAVRGGDLGALRDLALGVPRAGVRQATARREPQVAFLFTGQGAQRSGMGRELAAAFPPFARAHAAVCAAFTPYLDRPLREVIDDADDRQLHRTDYAQAALFAFEVALHALYESCGVRPAHLAGHSVGELVAAHVAGVLSLSDAVRLVAARGRLMAALPPGGAMAGVPASADEVEKLLADSTGPIALAAVNGPRSVVVSGTEEAVQELVTRLGRPAQRLTVSHAFHSPLLDPMLAGFRAVAESVTYHPPAVPVVSGLTGQPEPDAMATAGYWVRHARDTVRYADAVDWLDRAGTTAFVEVGPGAVLSVLAERCVAADSDAVFTPGVRSGTAALLDVLADLHVHGVAVDWRAVYADSGARRCALPTYPFQRQRYWIEATTAGPGSPHPLLGVAQPAADGPQVRHSGVLSTTRQPWLAGHVIGDDVVVPAAALIECAFQAAGGTGRLAELTISAPLVLTGPVDLQVVVDGTGAGDRPLTIWSRPQDSAQPWTSHATAVLTDPAGAAPAPMASWPPPGSQPVAVDYEGLEAAGFHYGGAFRAVTAVWHHGDEIYADLDLPAGEAVGAGRYGLHPALLDAALHAGLLAQPPDTMRVPHALRGVELHSPGAATARVTITRVSPDEVRVSVTDRAGRPVLTIDSLTTRELAGWNVARGLHRLDWVAAPDAGHDGPYEIFRPGAPADADVPARTRILLDATLARLREWVAADRPERLVVVTERATGAGPDPAAAAVWGLLGSARSEHPGRFAAVDLCGADASETALSRAAALAEPRLAVRAGTVLAPRLVPSGPADEAPPVLDPGRTVLITGGTGALGEILARHLVAEYGVRHLLLAGRRGTVPAWAADVPARVTVTACDVSDRSAVADLVASCRPSLTAVFHLAGVLDDGVLTAMTPERMSRVIAAKADAAWYLHEATEGLDLAAFVLYSSASGVLGRPGQANYAAANSFLDALAGLRAARGLPAQSLAWGLWDTADGGMPQRVASRQHLTGGGIRAITPTEGTALLDRALRTAEPVLVPIVVDTRALAGDGVPPVLAGLAPASAPRARAGGAEPGGWRAHLAALPAAERRPALQNLVQAEVAAVLGFPDGTALAVDRPFTDLGFDSLAAVQLRNRLGASSGVRLEATVALDHPTLAELTAHVYAALAGELPGSPAPAAVRDVRADRTERFTAIYHRVAREKGAREAMALRYLASYGLPAFGTDERDRHAVPPQTLARGDAARPVLAFIPDFLTLLDPAPVDLGRELAGEYDLRLLTNPGFGERREVPDTVATLVDLHADTVRDLAGDRSLVMVGYCTSGWIAHAVSERLTATGNPPAGLILIDSHHSDAGWDDKRALALATVDSHRPAEMFDGLVSDAMLLAGGAYVRLLDAWQPGPAAVPTLLLRAAPTREMLAADPGGDWRPRWPLPHEAVDIPGDHFTTLSQDARSTASAMREWLHALAAK